MAKRTAVIDIGSNSVRMVVYEKTSRFAFHLLHEAKSKVRISENAYKNSGNLQEIPMQRTYDALEDFLHIAASFQVRKILCVATSALRDAPNKNQFLEKVRTHLKLNIRVIDGSQEAYYGAIACANLLWEQSNALSIDIGGGSTEFAIINGKNISNTISIELGTVRLKELFFDKEKMKEAVAYIDKKLEVLDALDTSTLIGIGGTFRAIATAMIEIQKYPLDKIHGFESSRVDFEKFLYSVLKADEPKLKKLGIKSDRFDVIKPGVLILERVLNKMKITKIVSSGVGVREGVYLADLLRNSNDRLPTNYNTSVRYLLDSYMSEHTYANQLSTLCKKLFDLTHEHLGISSAYRYELAIAAKLSFIGNSVHFYSNNKHSFYIIQNALEYGFTHSQIVLIATLAKYAKFKHPSNSHINEYSILLPDNSTMESLSYLLSLSIALLSHRPMHIDFDVNFSDGKLYIESKKTLYLSKEALERLNTLSKLQVKF